jgi:hypothetical protein
MTSYVAIISDTEAEIRWRDWLARGVASDRRRATRMRRFILLIATAVAVWFSVQLT